jgi:hypothetical protein
MSFCLIFIIIIAIIVFTSNISNISNDDFMIIITIIIYFLFYDAITIFNNHFKSIIIIFRMVFNLFVYHIVN